MAAAYERSASQGSLAMGRPQSAGATPGSRDKDRSPMGPLSVQGTQPWDPADGTGGGQIKLMIPERITVGTDGGFYKSREFPSV